MQFVKTENLRAGMRLARPIYSKQGVLLFERDSRLTSQGIESIFNFGLIGLFILEPAEPVPPMTQEDLEFERFQTMEVYSIQEETNHILNTKKQTKMQFLASNVIKNYGHLEKRINFIQNLRSREDCIYKHELNVAILCAMITHVMNIRLDEQLSTILAALVHDIGKLSLPAEIMDADQTTSESILAIRKAETGAYDLIESIFSEGKAVRRICMQSQKALENMENGQASLEKMVTGARVLAVADMFDSLTAMKINGTPLSEVAALRVLYCHPETFAPEVVGTLIRCINILSPGASVELNTGEKALVINSNEKDILRPIVLSFRDNSIIDLGDLKNYGDIEIVDIMKTLDNRCIIDTNSLRKAGFSIDEPAFM
ncbi:MAG TPA: HD domain-containing phosphohydrolase [Lachnospiraceae bacterium]|nr:HD domain-containing phosphohydrolase [Lachnospiraceae bacterium]